MRDIPMRTRPATSFRGCRRIIVAIVCFGGGLDGQLMSTTCLFFQPPLQRVLIKFSDALLRELDLFVQ